MVIRMGLGKQIIHLAHVMNSPGGGFVHCLGSLSYLYFFCNGDFAVLYLAFRGLVSCASCMEYIS